MTPAPCIRFGTVVAPYVDEIIELGDRNSKTLGFLPYSGYHAAASASRIAVATNTEGDLLGYCLFDLPRDVVRIVQLCVSEAARGTHMARALIDAVSDQHSDRLGLVLKCRSDWPADKMWPKLGFAAQTLVPGRSKEGHLLTVWWRSHGHPDLFTLLQDFEASGSLAAIDSNVFCDLHSAKRRPGKNETAALAPLIASGDLVVALLPTVAREIYETPDAAERARFLHAKVNYRSAREPASEQVAEYLLAEIPASEIADDPSLVHDARLAAEAYANGVDLLITRDRNMVAKLAEPAGTFGVEILQPTEVSTFLDVEKADQSYRPAQLSETTFTIGRLDRGLTDTEIDLVLSKPEGERLPEIRATLADLARRSTVDVQRHALFDGNGSLHATWATREAEVLEVPLLRVVGGSLQRTVVAQLSRILRESALASGRNIVRVSDPRLATKVRSVLESDGFTAADGDLVGLTLPAVGPWSSVASAARTAAVDPNEAFAALTDLPDALSPAQAVELERLWAPAKILGEGIRTYLVPIKRPFAAHLLGYPAPLDHRADDLGLSREHVYYKAPRKQLRLPARILWYVSGSVDPSVIAASRVIDEEIDTPRRLHQRHERLGVWSSADIDAQSSHGKACAVRFADTEIFTTPIGLDRLRVLAANGQNLLLRSTQELDDESFAKIYREGMQR